MQDERSAKLMNYLNRPLDDVTQIEKQNERWNADGHSNITKKSEPKSNRDNRHDGINRVILRDMHHNWSNNTYYDNSYRAPPTSSHAGAYNKGYIPSSASSYFGTNRKFWGGGDRYSNAYRGAGRGFDRNRRRDFERRRDLERRDYEVRRGGMEYERGRNYYYRGGGGGGAGVGRGVPVPVAAPGVGLGPTGGGIGSGGRRYYRGRDYYYRGRKYYSGGYYYYRPYFNKRPYDTIAPPIRNTSAINGVHVNGYRRPLIKDSARRIIKDIGGGNVPRNNVVVSTGNNRYNVVPNVGTNRFSNLNISLYRNRRPVFPVSGRGGRVAGSRPMVGNRGNMNNSRLRLGSNKPIKRGPDGLKKENKIDTYLMSKIKIYTSPENIPPPLTEQLDADVNLPRSLKRRSNQKKED